MNPDRAIAMILGLSLAVVLALGIWMLRGSRESPPPPSPPTVTPAPSPTIGPTNTPNAAAAAARGYRLAGTVVGDLSYAIVEGPNGVNQLYRPGQTIPNVGEVISIEADRITLAGDIVLQLAPGPTTTPAPLATVTAGIATEEEAEPESELETTPVRRPRRGRSSSESLP